MENKKTLIEELKLTEAGSEFVEKTKPLEEEKSRRMTKREAIGRIVDHMTVHHIQETRAILITEALEMAIEALRNQEEERPKGKWIKGYNYPDGEYWKCTNCDELIRVRYPMKYCSNCGADMRESEVEE